MKKNEDDTWTAWDYFGLLKREHLGEIAEAIWYTFLFLLSFPFYLIFHRMDEWRSRSG